ncbi:MAG TPA: multicopper oxidase domain-containing protein [Polyangiaceae bacterium]|nr:multicopper oxidase domain-containing protein [Polyangiaceae bacterium]
MGSTLALRTAVRHSVLLAFLLIGCGSDKLSQPLAPEAGTGGTSQASSGGTTHGGAANGGTQASGGTSSSGGKSTSGGTSNTAGTTGNDSGVSGGAAAGGVSSDSGASSGGSTRDSGSDGAAGSAGAGGASGVAGAGGSAGADDADGGDSPAMPIPPVLAPTSTDATTDYYAITVKTGTAQMRPGAPTPIVGFNGIFPGPTLVATKGRAVQVTQTNAWTENITIHNHGHKAPAASDGHPIDYVTPGKSKVYTYPNDQNAATYWYHDHTMDLAGPHIYSGLAGFYVIHDTAEDALKLPSGKYDVPLMVQDKAFNDDNTLFYSTSTIGPGFIGKVGVVNGVVSPHFDVDTHKYRLRLLNASNARLFKVALKSGKSFQVIGSDGGLLSAPVSVTALSIAPAERYDVVVDFSGSAVGTTETLVNTETTMPLITDLVEFRVKNAVTDDSTVPSTLAQITRLQEAASAGTATWTFSQDFTNNGEWTINNTIYDPARMDQTSHLGSVYVWKLVNSSGFYHPFHKHLTEFQILDVDGKAPSPEQSGWKDTVQVPVGSTVRIIFADQTYTGTYVFHCHILEHEDHRMMLQESVVSP